MCTESVTIKIILVYEIYMLENRLYLPYRLPRYLRLIQSTIVLVIAMMVSHRKSKNTGTSISRLKRHVIRV
jgi:hypothetical protein